MQVSARAGAMGCPVGYAGMITSEQMAPRTHDRRASRTGWGLAWLAGGMWAAVLLIGLAYAAFINNTGDLGCNATTGGSNYGQFGWSVSPPGPTCTYTANLNGFDSVVGPTPVMSVWLVALVAGGIAVVSLIRRSRRSA